MQHLHNDLETKWRATLRGCKWFVLRQQILNLAVPQGTTITKIYFLFFYLIPSLCSGLYKNLRSGARGCKWLELRLQIHNPKTLYHHTNPKIYIYFFYLVRLLRSDPKTKNAKQVLLAANGPCHVTNSNLTCIIRIRICF